MNRYRTFLLAAGLLIALIGTGCQGLTSSSGKSTAIFGRVVDPAGTGIREIDVAVVYNWVNRKPGAEPPGSAAPTVAPAATPTAASLSHPYPNPDFDPESRPVTIRVQTDRDTTAEVGIWLVGSGVPTEVKQLFKGTLSGTKSWSWDGRDDIGSRLPNGFYTVRVYIPATSGKPALEEGILLNRPAPLVFSLAGGDIGILNAVSDVDGSYIIGDLPVGESFVRTDNSGSVQGGGVVDTQLTLQFRDPGGDYVDQSQSIFIGVGQQVDKTTVLQPVARAAGSRLP